mgnify:CR=1 FL=1
MKDDSGASIAEISFFRRDFLTYMFPVESPVNTLMALAEKPENKKYKSTKFSYCQQIIFWDIEIDSCVLGTCYL